MSTLFYTRCFRQNMASTEYDKIFWVTALILNHFLSTPQAIIMLFVNYFYVYYQ